MHGTTLLHRQLHNLIDESGSPNTQFLHSFCFHFLFQDSISHSFYFYFQTSCLYSVVLTYQSISSTINQCTALLKLTGVIFGLRITFTLLMNCSPISLYSEDIIHTLVAIFIYTGPGQQLCQMNLIISIVLEFVALITYVLRLSLAPYFVGLCFVLCFEI